MSRNGPSRMAGILTCLALAVSMTIAGAAPGPAAAVQHPTSSSGRSAHPARLVETKIPDRGNEIPDTWLPGYQGAPRARVLLPPGYDPHRTYPLMVLLSGLNGNYRNWSASAMGMIRSTAAGFPGIIVMPEGASGWYFDWWREGRRGQPSWETYYIDQVIPQIMHRYPIRQGRRWHALVGVSMGGMGAAYLGGRMAGFFGSVAILSGLVDMHLYPLVQGVAVSAIPEADAGATLDLDAVMGPDNGFYSRGHDPMNLAANLDHTRVYMTAGNGIPTSDGLPADETQAPINVVFESAIIRPASDRYAAVLRRTGVDLTYRTHNGAHDWPNARQELRGALRWGLFKPVVAAPKAWEQDTVATRGPLWDLQFRFATPPSQIVHFSRVGQRLTIGRAGSDVVITTPSGCRIQTTTPAVIKPWATHCH